MSKIKLQKTDKSFIWEVMDFFKDLIIIIIIVKTITIFFVSIFIINGQSMYSSYYDKGFILVDRFSTQTFFNIKKQDIKRWDVVVVKPEVDPIREYFIKRIVWMPGEMLKIKDWNVFIKKSWKENFIKLDEKYLNKENYWKTKVDNQLKENIYIIPEWKYFVMWDNRNQSSDSRSCFSSNCNNVRDQFIWKDFIVWKVLIDLGYFNFKNFSFTHPVIKEDWNFIDTSPKWVNSEDSYNYNY